MKACRSGEVRNLDKRSAEEAGLPGIVLMENAGRAIAAAVARLRPERILVFAGKGNNGGDAFSAARLLEKTAPVRLVMACSPAELYGDALTMYQRMPEHLKKNSRKPVLKRDFQQGIIVDGLLGTGISGAPREPYAELIRSINRSKMPVLAIDLPSGLNADDGSVPGEAVAADLTVTMAMVKSGMLLGKGPELCGRIELADIGIPDRFLEEAIPDFEVFSDSDAKLILSREPFDTFKNRRGLTVVFAGSKKYSGAPFLTAEAALRTGAGLVKLVVPEEMEIFRSVPAALIVNRSPGEVLCQAENLEDWMKNAASIAVGPGMDTSEKSVEFLRRIIAEPLPKVLDADALNLISRHPEILTVPAETVLTPHPGELKRLFDAFHVSTPENLARKTNCVLVLKGARTKVMEPNGKFTVNLSGNPALATAGSGDVLTGIIAALLANGYPARDAARLGVFLHGRTADLLLPLGSRGICADDLPKTIENAFKTISEIF